MEALNFTPRCVKKSSSHDIAGRRGAVEVAQLGKKRKLRGIATLSGTGKAGNVRLVTNGDCLTHTLKRLESGSSNGRPLPRQALDAVKQNVTELMGDVLR